MVVANSGTGGPRMQTTRPQPTDDIAALQKSLWDFKFEVFQATFSTNVTAVYFTTVAFLSLLHEGKKKARLKRI